jgi:hypothetical protein
MALAKRPAESLPAQRFRMPGVTFFVVLDDGNNRVQFSVFTEKAISV